MKRKIAPRKRIHFDQSGVIPYRKKNGRTEVLLVTSIRRKNWLIPKGFIEYHLTPFQSAKKEAFEEAGVRGSNATRILGSYTVRKNGSELPTKIYSMKVTRVFKDYPEKVKSIPIEHVMKYKIEPPYYPVVYVRGYAMTSGERDDTFHDTYHGFAATSVEKRDAPPPDYFRADLFEGQLIRFMKLGKRAYYDGTNRGLEDCDDNPSRSLWVCRFYDDDVMRDKLRVIE